MSRVSKLKVQTLPALPLRDIVVFPRVIVPLFVGREKSIQSLQMAMADKDNKIILVAQKDPEIESPEPDDLYQVGVLAEVLQLLSLPDGTLKILVEGVSRVANIKFSERKDFFSASFVPWTQFDPKEDQQQIENHAQQVMDEFIQLSQLSSNIPEELADALNNLEEPGHLADAVAAHLSFKLDLRQQLLEVPSILHRLQLLLQALTTEVENLAVDHKLQANIKEQVDENQRRYFLGEKLKAIQKELGELPGSDVGDELQLLVKKIESSGMPTEAKDKAHVELNKLKLMPPMSSEATVCRNYLEWLVDVPWKKTTRMTRSLQKAEDSLDDDHYGLEEVKARILEYLAVQKRVKKLKGPIICLVGPPGVGKTSLGQSIANATGRTFVRISLGGVRDEAEIRGHRRTYIGAMPGKIIQKMVKAKVRNPLFMLDEVDKMDSDFRGDPASALLEVLDPEQNHTFSDHFLEVDYDLSDVMFVATANSLNIPLPLLDRMEIIRLSGYTELEKLNISKRYLVPRQITANGLEKDELKINDEALLAVIRNYTREAGVRGLDRQLSKLCRKVVRAHSADSYAKNKNTSSKVSDTDKPTHPQVKINSKALESYLGVHKYRFGLAESYNQVGQVTGLAWTEVGGELLTIEAQIVPGKGQLQQTGRLGKVMEESIFAAMTVVRVCGEAFKVTPAYFQKHDIHIHVPEGATPKDGPSAGVGMCTALASAITGIPVRADVAMTGEITLRGEILPIGGLKEKLLAALRGGIKTVLIPWDNEKDLEEIPKNVTSMLTIYPVRWVDEVLFHALEKPTKLMLNKIKSKTSALESKKVQSKSSPKKKSVK